MGASEWKSLASELVVSVFCRECKKGRAIVNFVEPDEEEEDGVECARNVTKDRSPWSSGLPFRK